MFLIRMVFWLGLVVLVLPTDERQQARLYGAAVATVERVTTFCDRNPKTCTAGSSLWAAFVQKAEFGARLAFDLISSRGRQDETSPASVQPASAKARPEPAVAPAQRGTLKPGDLAPAWRGHVQRTGT